MHKSGAFWCFLPVRSKKKKRPAGFSSSFLGLGAQNFFVELIFILLAPTSLLMQFFSVMQDLIK